MKKLKTINWLNIIPDMAMSPLLPVAEFRLFSKTINTFFLAPAPFCLRKTVFKTV